MADAGDHFRAHLGAALSAGDDLSDDAIPDWCGIADDALIASESESAASHHIAAIQDFGALIAIDREHRLVHRSANLATVLGLNVLPAIGTPIAAFIDPAALSMIRDILARLPSENLIERRFGIDLVGTGALFDCAAHLSCGLAVIEFEPHADDEFADHLGLIGPALSRLEQQDDPVQLCEVAAQTVREMLGYDRVIVYRFHSDDRGEVIAEDAAGTLRPYLGQRYPAADLPREARALFRRSRFRVIADMAAKQVPLLPALGPDDDPLDLSMSMLRAHSHMHLAHMRNLGVGASLAIAIVRHDRLWGMIVCHHMTPRRPAYSLRTVAELFSQSFSLMLDRVLRQGNAPIEDATCEHELGPGQAAARPGQQVAELNHRVRSILGLIRSLMIQSQPNGLSASGLAAIISERIAALAWPDESIRRENWSSASLAALIATELTPYLGENPHRFRLEGADVQVRPAAYTIIALVVHELAINSARHGSLSTQTGRVAVRLARTGSGDLSITWREHGGPPVDASACTGFGSAIIRRAIPRELKGEAALFFQLRGLEAEFLIPAHHLAPVGQGTVVDRPATSPTRPLPASSCTLPSQRRPGKVLLVEDSIVIALDTEENLKRLGVGDVRVEGSVAGALAAISEAPPDFAIIDFNLGEESSEPVAAALRTHGVPFVLATGYAEHTDAIGTLGAEAVLRKPYGRAEIERLLEIG